MSRSRDPPSGKKNTSHAVSEANKDKEVKLIVQISFAEKIKFKEEGSVTFQNFFLPCMAGFRDVANRP